MVPAWALDAEADAFFCFSAIMAEMGDVRYYQDNSARRAQWHGNQLACSLFCASPRPLARAVTVFFVGVYCSQVFTKNLDMHNTGLLGALDHMNG